MNMLRIADYRDALLLFVLICVYMCQAVISEECRAVKDNSNCHCRTDSGYEINLMPLASDSGPR